MPQGVEENFLNLFQTLIPMHCCVGFTNHLNV